MGMFETALVLATFLCSLIAGFLFAFAIAVMPGLRRLDDTGFLRAFKAIDGIIQGNQPVFLVVWVGSALALMAAAVLGLNAQEGSARIQLIVITLVYLLGVQVPTIAINVPLNNAIQKLDLEAIEAAGARRAREAFEARWNRWNVVRTICACVVSASLSLIVIRVVD